MNFVRFFLALITLASLQHAARNVARACSVPAVVTGIQPAEPLAGATIEGVPREGVLVLRAVAAQWPPQGVTITMKVTHGNEEVPGTIEPNGDLEALVWRSSSPLSPSTQYAALLTITLNGAELTKYEFAFNTAADAAPTLGSAPTITNPMLVEYAKGNTICCEIMVPTCGGNQMCWSDEFVYLPRLQGSIAHSVPSAIAKYTYAVVRRVNASGESDSAEKSLRLDPTTSGSLPFAVDYAAEQTSYCIAVELHNIIDGSSVQSDTLCAQHTTLTHADRSDTQPSMFDTECTSEPIVYRDVHGTVVNKPWQPPTSNACSVAATVPTPVGSGAHVLLLLASLASLTRRRRRSR